MNLAAAWIARGLPAIVTRQDGDRQWLALGIPLPPRDSKKRIALRVRSNNVIRLDSLTGEDGWNLQASQTQSE